MRSNALRDTWIFLAAIVVGCSRLPNAATLGLSPAGAATSIATATTTAVSAPRQRPGFVALVNGTPWTARPPRYTASLMDSMVPTMGAFRRATTAGVPDPREISIDVSRADDRERIVLNLKLVPGFMGRHAYECNATKCSPRFEGQLFRAGGFFTTKQPSVIEVTKYEQIGPQQWRISLWFDLKLDAVGGPKGKPVRAVGVVENAELIDVGEPVGLLGGNPAEMDLLSVQSLPDGVRPAQDGTTNAGH